MEFNPGLIAIVAIIMAIFVGLLIWATVQGQRRRITTGREGMVGEVAEVKTELKPRGMVMVEGELWTAELDSGIAKPGEQVIVTKVDNLKLYVTKKQ